MAYTPTEWETADIVTAARMNALETAVGDMNMSYTPNTWSDGDILTAAKMNALEQAVASGGGGGSSDFSTAEVTIEGASFDHSIRLQGALALDYHDPNYPEDDDSYSSYTPPTQYISENIALNIILYKGKAVINALAVTQADSISVSGDISPLFMEGDYLITGDCTVTIS